MREAKARKGPQHHRWMDGWGSYAYLFIISPMLVRCLTNITLHKSINLNDVLQSTNYDGYHYTVFVFCRFLTSSFKYFFQRILRRTCKITKIDY
jgi:hypothetical protein